MNATSATVLLLASNFLNLCCDDCEKPVTESECWSHSVSTERQSCSEEGEPDDDLFTARHVAAPTCSPRALDGTLSGNDVDVVKANRAPLCENEKSHPTLTLDTEGVRA